MKYSDFAIKMLKERLVEKSMRPSTPKKYAGDMFEAYEVIVQLEKEIEELTAEANLYKLL